MSKHTPGPWIAEHLAPGNEHIPHHIFHDSEVIAGTFASPESASNARLIAAAPEMLDLLRRLVGDNRDPRDFPDQYFEARALLARIEGDA